MATINWQNAPTAEERLEKAKSAKLAEINKAAEAQVAAIRRQYPQFEIDSWTEQKSEALAYQADSSAETPFLFGVAKERGISLDELVEKVMKKVELYRNTVAPVTGKRQRLEKRINTIKNSNELSFISW